MSELTNERKSDLEASSAILLHAVSALSRRRADLIGIENCDRLVDLGWLEWHGGALQLTQAGSAVCDHALMTYT